MRFRLPRVALPTWVPTDDYPAARVYRSDTGVTSSSSATRQSAGITTTDVMVGALYGEYRPGPDPDPGGLIASGGNVATDGQAILELPSGRIILMGGAPGGHAYQRVNTVWASDDDGATFVEILPDGEPSSTRPAPGHTYGGLVHDVDSVPYVYWIGGDPFDPTGNVFRIPAAELDVGGDPETPWERICTTCPTSGLALFMYGELDGDLYIFGGQTSIEDTGTVSKKVYRSEDDGETWDELDGSLDCPATLYGAQLGPVPVKDGKFWFCGSARYHSTINDFSNAVHTFDGSAWDEVLADGHAEFPKNRYHSVVVDEAGKLWLFTGTTWDGVTLAADTDAIYYSSDGASWDEWTQPNPSGNSHARAAVATSRGIFYSDGFQTARLNIIEEFSGALVSSVDDAGSDDLDVSQATDAAKPILDVDVFPSKAGIVFTGAQELTLAAPDRGLTDEVFEVYIGAKTRNFDTTPEQGGPNPPCVLVGAVNGSSWNNFGLNGGVLTYKYFDGGWQEVTAGTSYNDGVFRVYGVVHTADFIRLYVDGVMVAEDLSVGFDTSWTGWDTIGGGYLSADRGAFAMGFAVVLTPTEPSSDAFRSKLQTFAQGWM